MISSSLLRWGEHAQLARKKLLESIGSPELRVDHSMANVHAPHKI